MTVDIAMLDRTEAVVSAVFGTGVACLAVGRVIRGAAERDDREPLAVESEVHE